MQVPQQTPARSASAPAKPAKSLCDDDAIHLPEDHRRPVKVHDRARIRDTAQRLVDTHPLW